MRDADRCEGGELMEHRTARAQASGSSHETGATLIKLPCALPCTLAPLTSMGLLQGYLHLLGTRPLRLCLACCQQCFSPPPHGVTTIEAPHLCQLPLQP